MNTLQVYLLAVDLETMQAYSKNTVLAGSFLKELHIEKSSAQLV